TPDYAATQPLILEFARGAVYALVQDWLGQVKLLHPPMPIGIVEAVKKAVASGLGMSIVPGVAMAEPVADGGVRPLRPPVPCTLALIEHSGKPDAPALKIVRDALLELKACDPGEPVSAAHRGSHDPIRVRSAHADRQTPPPHSGRPALRKPSA